MHRSTTIALVATATLALAACGTRAADEVEPVDRRPAAAPDLAAAWQAYYDMTHPPPRTAPPPRPGEAFQVYYDLTHPMPAS